MCLNLTCYCHMGRSILNFVLPRTPAIVARIANETEQKLVKVEVKNGKSDTTVTKLKIPTIAKRVGLQPGDQFIEMAGQPVLYYDEVIKIVKSGPRDSLSFKIRRGEQVLAFKENFKGQEIIGFNALFDKKELAYTNYNLGQSIGLGAQRAFDVIFVQLKAFKKIFSGEISFRKSLSGPIGMAQAYG